MNVTKLSKQLQQLGMGSNHLAALTELSATAGPSFDYRLWDYSDRQPVAVNLKVVNYNVRYYDVTMKCDHAIPDKVVGGIDVTALDRKMKAVDWNQDAAATTLEAHWVKRPVVNTLEPIASAIRELFELRDHSIDGQDIADKLMTRHWLDTRISDCFPNKLDHLRNRVSIDARHQITLEEAKTVLRGQPLQKVLDINGKPVKYNVGQAPDGSLMMKVAPGPRKMLDQGISI